MLFLHDHLISILIAGAVLLILAQVILQAQDAGIEATSRYAGYTHTLNFADVINRDFQNIGAGVDATAPMIINYSWTASSKLIEFRGAIGSAATDTVEQIKYQVFFADSVDTLIDGAEERIAVYQVRRFVMDSGGAYQFSGASIPTIREFDIELADGAGIPVTAVWDDTRQLSVRMVTVPPLMTERAQHHNEWQTRFRPTSLTLKD